jgi:hypothetical protein
MHPTLASGGLLAAALFASALPREDPRAWVWFTSAEAEDGVAPKLVVTVGEENHELRTTDDATILEYLGNRVLGSQTDLAVNLADTNRALVRFDLSALPAVGEIDTATVVLDMHLSNIPPREAFWIDAHRVLSDWDEGTVSWQTQPEFESEPLVRLWQSPRSGVVRFDITEAVREWRADELAPNGLLLRISSASKESGPPDLTFPSAEAEVKMLPWPHQAPGASRRETRELVESLFVINDFSLYQADGNGSYSYFHGGLDVVLPRGTPIYALEDGWVKGIVQSTIVIGAAEDAKPAFGWAYTHLEDFQFGVGDFVKTGERIAQVGEHALEHLHLDRVFSEGEHWPDWKYICPPYDHFEFVDEDPPVITAPFAFFENDAGETTPARFERKNEKDQTVVRGSVDIVVGMRDPGLYAHSKENGFGDRLGVARIDYRIRGRGVREGRASFDFREIRFKKGYEDRTYSTAIAHTVFKHWTLLETEGRTGHEALSYYVVTNHPTEGRVRELSSLHRDHAWDTTKVPDGVYEITVTAVDWKGNETTESTSVEVENDE